MMHTPMKAVRAPARACAALTGAGVLAAIALEPALADTREATHATWETLTVVAFVLCVPLIMTGWCLTNEQARTERRKRWGLKMAYLGLALWLYAIGTVNITLADTGPPGGATGQKQE